MVQNPQEDVLGGESINHRGKEKKGSRTQTFYRRGRRDRRGRQQAGVKSKGNLLLKQRQLTAEDTEIAEKGRNMRFKNKDI